MSEQYKINIHAHTVFSDGANTPITLAHEAKRLGFTALVLTDHYYGSRAYSCGLTPEKYNSYKRALSEARKVLPVIVGLEVPFLGQEILIFGGFAVKYLLKKDRLPTVEEIALFRKNGCLFILCHPSEGFEAVVPYVDGYERYNAGDDMFANDRPLCGLENKQAWFNSDAHKVSKLGVSYNLVNKKITEEGELLNYIKQQRSVEHALRGVEPNELTSE